MIWGKTYEKEHLEEEEYLQKAKRWKSWFAWYPVRLKPDDGRWVWLEEVEYRTDVDDLDIGHLGSYSNFYRLKNKKHNGIIN